MSTRNRTFIQGMLGAAIALVFTAAPARAATLPVPLPAPVVQCVLEPGVYGVVDSSGRLVGILIVYPDCRIEVFKRVEPE